MRGRLPAVALYVLVGILATYHVSLLGRGALAVPDEFMSFRGSLQVVDGTLRGDWTMAAAGTIGFWGARPAEFLIRAPAAALQRLVERSTGLPPSSPRTLPLATAQNVAVAAGLALVFFYVTRRLIPDDSVAALGAAAFSLLASNHSWVRHLVPYDAALAMHLVALALCLRVDRIDARWPTIGVAALSAVPPLVLTIAYPWVFYRSRGLGLPWACLTFLAWLWFGWRTALRPRGPLVMALVTGAVEGIALGLYPAYYSFVPALGLIILLSASPARLLWLGPGTVLTAAAYATGVVTVLFGFETIARVGNVSYFGAAALMPQTIDQGSYEEGFVFLPKYLFATDGLGAVFLLAAAGVGLVSLARAWIRATLTEAEMPVARVTAVLGGLYLVYGFQSAVLHHMSFSGRYARMYIPVVVWLATLAVARLGGRLRKCSVALWLACAVVGFAGFAADYARVDYPADVLFDAGIGYEDLDPRYIWEESELIPNYNLPVKEVTVGSSYVTQPRDQRFHIVNFGIFALYGRPLEAFRAPPGYALAVSRRHFMSSPTMAFEGYPQSKRAELLTRRYPLQIWCRVDTCPLVLSQSERSQ